MHPIHLCLNEHSYLHWCGLRMPASTVESLHHSTTSAQKLSGGCAALCTKIIVLHSRNTAAAFPCHALMQGCLIRS